MSLTLGFESLNIDSNITDSFKNIVASAEVLKASDESFGKSLRIVTDLFMRTCITLKHSLFGINKSIKRAELEKYHNDHILILKAIDALSYMEVKDVLIDIPSGMKQRYGDTLMVLKEAYSNMDVTMMLDETFNKFKAVRHAVLNRADLTQPIDSLMSTLVMKEGFVKTMGPKLNGLFNQSSSPKAKFSSQFNSMQEFHDTRVLCVELEQYLTYADQLSKTSTELSFLIQDITDAPDVELTQAQRNSLVDCAMIIANLLDIYGTASLYLMAISHNLVLVCNTLYGKVK